MPDRILCFIPVYHAVEPLPFLHFLSVSHETAMAEARGEYAVRWMVGGPKSQIQVIRNQACQAAIERNATHLLLVDDDMLLSPSNIVKKLLDHDKDIVGPLFFRSGGNHEPLAYAIDKDGATSPILDYPKDTLFETTGGIGTGVMLIKTSVLKTMGGPWFKRPDSPTLGPDLEFCQRAIRTGFQVWCDTSLIVKQMGLPYPIGEAEFLALTQKV